MLSVLSQVGWGLVLIFVGTFLIPLGSTASGQRGQAREVRRSSSLTPPVVSDGPRTFVVVDIIEIFVHWYAGRSKTEVATSLGVASKDGREVPAAGRVVRDCAGRPADGRGGPVQAHQGLFPEMTDRRLRQIT